MERRKKLFLLYLWWHFSINIKKKQSPILGYAAVAHLAASGSRTNRMVMVRSLAMHRINALYKSVWIWFLVKGLSLFGLTFTEKNRLWSRQHTLDRSQILNRSFWALPSYTRLRSRATSISSSSVDNDFAEISLTERITHSYQNLSLKLKWAHRTNYFSQSLGFRWNNLYNFHK